MIRTKERYIEDLKKDEQVVVFSREMLYEIQKELEKQSVSTELYNTHNCWKLVLIKN